MVITSFSTYYRIVRLLSNPEPGTPEGLSSSSVGVSDSSSRCLTTGFGRKVRTPIVSFSVQMVVRSSFSVPPLSRGLEHKCGRSRRPEETRLTYLYECQQDPTSVETFSSLDPQLKDFGTGWPIIFWETVKFEGRGRTVTLNYSTLTVVYYCSPETQQCGRQPSDRNLEEGQLKTTEFRLRFLIT